MWSGVDLAREAPSKKRSRRTAAQREDDSRRLAEAIDRLPERSRLALALRHYESVRVARIAGILDLPENEVRAILAEAVSAVMQRLQEESVAHRDGAGRNRKVPAGRAAASGSCAATAASKPNRTHGGDTSAPAPSSRRSGERRGSTRASCGVRAQ